MALNLLQPVVAASLAQRTLTRSYKANGSLTVPADVYSLDLLLVSGGGGGGGGYNVADGVGGGGGSGWPVRCTQPVQPGDVVAFNVGAGGAGGAGLGGVGTATSGANGGDTFVTVNGVEVVRVPGGGGGGARSSSNAPLSQVGRASWGTYGAPGAQAAPWGGGGGAGYSGGVGGSMRADVFNMLSGYATGFERVRAGRRSPILNTKLTQVGSTNGWPGDYDSGTLATDQYLLIPERFFSICWGGTVATDALAPANQPANSGHGGTGAGGGDTIAKNTGGNGGSGFVVAQYVSAL